MMGSTIARIGLIARIDLAEAGQVIVSHDDAVVGLPVLSTDFAVNEKQSASGSCVGVATTEMGDAAVVKDAAIVAADVVAGGGSVVGIVLAMFFEACCQPRDSGRGSDLSEKRSIKRTRIVSKKFRE
jgi:hypothetical protein